MNRDPKTQPTVFIVDDDDAIRDSLVWLLEGHNYRVEAYATAQDFLARYRPTAAPACLVLDVRMPGMTGPQLQDKLLEKNVSIPVIFVTGHGEVAMAVDALKKGAVDFIEKPFADEKLVALIERAINSDAGLQERRKLAALVKARLETLSPREREVLDMVVQGKLNKTIADQLGISMKTVEAHRARVMEKMNAGSLAELVRLTLTQREVT